MTPTIQPAQTVSKATSPLRALIRRGAYAEAVAFGQALPHDLQRQPAVALLIIRACMHQGDMQQAEASFAHIDRQQATPGEALILALEAASLQVFHHANFTAALTAIQHAFDLAPIATLSPAEQAEAERVAIRIRLTAATYYELNAAEKDAALARLPHLAATLTAAGWLDEALAAHLTRAEQLSTPADRLPALATVANIATAAQRPAVAAEALVNRANLLITTGASAAAVEAELARAATLYAQADHIYGQHEVARTRARLAIERDHAALTAWEEILAIYEALGYQRGVISVLLDLSQVTHHRGAIAAAIGYRQNLVERAAAVGMGLLRDSEQTALVDLLMRNHNFGAAIESCQAALATKPPAFMAAGFEQLLATAYGFVQDYPAALHHLRQAIATYERLGVTDSTSDASLLLANYLDAHRQDAAWTEAETLLQSWQVCDEARGALSALLSKVEMRAQLCINRYLYSPTARGHQPLLHEADTLLRDALPLTTHLQGMERVRRAGALHQLRAQVHSLQDDILAVIDAWRTALHTYETGGLAMEAANCHYILGALYLNRANQELQPNFGEAETHFLTALDYYTAAYMRGQAADTRFMLARLYTNASVRVGGALHEQLLTAALAHLADAEADYDAIRREYAVGAVLTAQRGKQTLVEKSRRIYTLALELVTLHHRDEEAAWRWTQRAKARALTDALGAGAVTPARILAALADQPTALALVETERTLVAALEQAAPDAVPAQRAALAAHYQQMQQDPRLADYLELRHGLPPEPADLAALVTGPTGAVEPCVFIDWITVEDRLFFLALRPGATPYVERLALPVSHIQRFVADNLNERSFRLTLRDHPALLRELDSLLTPIALVAKPGDLLVLAPSGPLHALPLHALELDGAPLIAHHPIVYTPSLSVLRHCVARAGSTHTIRRVALFGDPSDDTANAVALVNHLTTYFRAEHLPTTTFLGAQVTRTAFTEASPHQDLLYFHGHAVHDATEPLASHLKLADGPFAAHEVFGLRDLTAELVLLTACQSAASVIATGDEPLGLIPAFLYAGARSVLASQWRVQRTAAAALIEHFLSALFGLPLADRLVGAPLSTGAPIPADEQPSPAASAAAHLPFRQNKAKALQQAILALRRDSRFAAPYYWAPFVLYGDWR